MESFEVGSSQRNGTEKAVFARVCDFGGQVVKVPDLVLKNVQSDCGRFEPIRNFSTIQVDFDG